MKTNSKKLEEIRKENPFRVPENYFEHFNQEIMNRLPEKDFLFHEQFRFGTRRNRGFIWLPCF
jgi:hypothetical protein